MKYIKINFFSILLIINTNTAKSAESRMVSTIPATIQHEYSVKNINHKNEGGNTALMDAIFTQNHIWVDQLLKVENINLNLQNKLGRSALHLATINQNTSLITQLIEAGANPMLLNQRGATIAFFTHVINDGKLSRPIFEKIISAKDNTGNTHLHILAVADIKGMAKNSRNKSRRHVLNTLLNHLTDAGISIWELNNKKERAVEVAYKKFQEYKNQYENDKKITSKKMLRTQELILHVFLLHYIRSEQEELIPIASAYAQELNVETKMAKQYENDANYYQSKHPLEAIETEKNNLRASIDTISKPWISNSSVTKNLQSQIVTYIDLPHCAYS